MSKEKRVPILKIDELKPTGAASLNLLNSLSRDLKREVSETSRMTTRTRSQFNMKRRIQMQSKILQDDLPLREILQLPYLYRTDKHISVIHEILKNVPIYANLTKKLQLAICCGVELKKTDFSVHAGVIPQSCIILFEGSMLCNDEIVSNVQIVGFHDVITATPSPNSLRSTEESITVGYLSRTRIATLICPLELRKAMRLFCSVPLFDTLRIDELFEWVRVAENEKYDSGEIILKQNTDPGPFILVESGKCSVVKVITDEEQLVPLEIGHLTRGSYFGDYSLLKNCQKYAAIICETQCEIYSVQPSIWRSLVNKDLKDDMITFLNRLPTRQMIVDAYHGTRVWNDYRSNVIIDQLTELHQERRRRVLLDGDING
ncbi:hypothetical protein PCE1_004052 [Barthelona sp. PCE]